MTEKPRQDSSAADAPKLLDLGQVATTLDVPLYLVKLAIQNLGERIACEMGGKRHNKRLYGPQAVEKIQRHIDRLKARAGTRHQGSGVLLARACRFAGEGGATRRLVRGAAGPVSLTAPSSSLGDGLHSYLAG